MTLALPEPPTPPLPGPALSPDPRALARWRANALVEALWGLAHGVRDWESIPTRPHTESAYVVDLKVTASTSHPERLRVRVPGLPQLGILTHEVLLYRKDYEQLLEAWGYTALKATEALRSQLARLRAEGEKPPRKAGQKPGQPAERREDVERRLRADVRASDQRAEELRVISERLATLAESGRVRQPVRALTWSNYLSSPRLAALFAWSPHSKSVQLAPRRSGDLRECAFALLDACQVLPGATLAELHETT